MVFPFTVTLNFFIHTFIHRLKTSQTEIIAEANTTGKRPQTSVENVIAQTD